jgi:hypothetical protein
MGLVLSPLNARMLDAGLEGFGRYAVEGFEPVATGMAVAFESLSMLGSSFIAIWIFRMGLPPCSDRIVLSGGAPLAAPTKACLVQASGTRRAGKTHEFAHAQLCARLTMIVI